MWMQIADNDKTLKLDGCYASILQNDFITLTNVELYSGVNKIKQDREKRPIFADEIMKWHQWQSRSNQHMEEQAKADQP